MTIDEELDRLEETIRQLKIEFDIFFNGGSRKPPYDTQRRVDTLIKKHSEGAGLTFAQRFRFNGLVQRHAAFSAKWRQRIKSMEEGPRRTISDLHTDEGKGLHFRIGVDSPASSVQEVDVLFTAFRTAKQSCGEEVDTMDSETFRQFVRNKTDQIKRDFECDQVEYSIRIEEGRVRLKAKAL